MRTSLLALLILFATTTVAFTLEKLPKVIVIMAEDMGYGDPFV